MTRSEIELDDVFDRAEKIARPFENLTENRTFAATSKFRTVIAVQGCVGGEIGRRTTLRW